MLSLFDIRQICQEYSIVPQKSQGQNFLFDDNIVKKIITAANLNVQDTVLEIGPGLGVLTDYLINEAGQVIAVELDKKLLGFLEKRYQSVNNLKIIEGEMNLLAVAVQFYAEPQVLFEVSRQSFWPSPKVDSAVIKIKRKSQLFPVDQKLFFRLVKIGFSAKRKQLQNNLANGFHLEKNQAKDLIIKSGLAEKIRAQDLELKDWLRILEQL